MAAYRQADCQKPRSAPVIEYGLVKPLPLQNKYKNLIYAVYYAGEFRYFH